MTSLTTRLRSMQNLLRPYDRWPNQQGYRAGDVADPGEREERLFYRRDALLGDPSIQAFLREFPREAAAVELELNELLHAPERGSGDEASLRDQEQSLLAAFQSELAETLPRRWTTSNRYRKYLQDHYGEREVPLGIYDREASRLRKARGQASREASEALKQEISQAWKSALEVREEERRLKREQASNAQILGHMERRVTRFRDLHRLLEPIRGYLAFSWDLSSANLQESFFGIVKRSDEIMKQQAKIKEIAKRLGRLQQSEQANFTRSLPETRPETWMINRAAKSSVVGIRESDDISAIISSEAVLLASALTETLFYLKFAEKKLLTYDYQPEEHSRERTLPKGTRRQRVRQRGPIIIAVDTSASMKGEAEENAKALALSLTRIAFRQRRPVHLISFSTQAESVTLSPCEAVSLDPLVRFLLMSFHGGTLLETALAQALRMLKRPDYHMADMVFLTDGEADRFDSADVAAMNAARAEGVRFYSLLVGKDANGHLLAQFDYNWQYLGNQLTDLAINLERYRRGTLTA